MPEILTNLPIRLIENSPLGRFMSTLWEIFSEIKICSYDAGIHNEEFFRLKR